MVESGDVHEYGGRAWSRLRVLIAPGDAETSAQIRTLGAELDPETRANVGADARATLLTMGAVDGADHMREILGSSVNGDYGSAMRRLADLVDPAAVGAQVRAVDRRRHPDPSPTVRHRRRTRRWQGL